MSKLKPNFSSPNQYPSAMLKSPMVNSGNTPQFASYAPSSTPGRTYSSNFIGPIRPQDTMATNSFIGPTYGYPSVPPSSSQSGTSLQGNSGGNNDTSAMDFANQLYDKSSGEENKYIDQLLQQTGNQHDLMLKKLDAEHKLALGNDDTARAQFLESVANKLEDTIGRIPYDYQRYNARELQQYALGNTALAQNKQLALQKLDNDSQALSQNQGAANQNLAESLNQRGVLTGQTPQYNMLNQSGNSGISGISGVGGLSAQMQNNQYNNQFGAIANQMQGVNNDYSQQKNNLDFQQANTLQDLQTNARRDAQDQQNAYTFGTTQANNQYEQQRQAIERQRLLDNQTNRINANRQAGIGSNVYGQQ